jgi:hypothetical protein
LVPDLRTVADLVASSMLLSPFAGMGAPALRWLVEPATIETLFRFVAAAYERRSLGIGSHWPFESWGRFLPEHTTAVSMLDRLLHHCHVLVPTATATA